MVRIPIITHRSWTWTFSWILTFIHGNGWKNCLSLKLVVQKQFLWKEPCSQRSKGLSCPKEHSCSQEKKGLKLLPNNHVHEKTKLKLLQGTTIFFKAKKLLLFKNMIILWGENGLSFSLGQLKLLLLGDIIVPWEKHNFLKEQWTFLKERPKFLEETYVSNILQSQSSHVYYYICLWLIIGKV